ncbi:MAG: putative rane protein [Herbinix sp.]|jgi:sporulation integral membrane protein YtvI|nr:putative rane protein [Herbinix sp.]
MNPFFVKMWKLGVICMKLKEETASRLKWIIIIVVTTLGVYLGFRYLLPLILPFLFAYFLAWIIRPVTEFLYRKLKIPRIIGGSVTLLLLIALVGTGIFYLCNMLLKQAIAFIKNIPIYMDLIADKLDNICGNCDKMFGLNDGFMKSLVDEHFNKTINRVKSNIMPQLTEHTVTITIGIIGFLGIMLIIFVSAVLIVKDLPAFTQKYKDNNFYQDIHTVTAKLSDAGIAYLRSQLIIMIIIAFLCVLSLTFLKNDYALLIGVGIAIMDALPILGSGIILVPWSIIMLINGNIFAAAILITTFLVCQIIREILEPRLIGKRIGIKPLFTLVAMYIGVKLFSIAGFILGPIGLIIIITILKVISDKSKESTQESTQAGNTV